MGAGGWEPHGSSPTACAEKVDQPQKAVEAEGENSILALHCLFDNRELHFPYNNRIPFAK